MRAIFKREIKNYLKRPLFWIGIIIVIFGVFSAVSPYLATHYLEAGEEIVNDLPKVSDSGDVHEGYVPVTEEQRREFWNVKMKEALVSEYKMKESDAQEVISQMKDMDIDEACDYMEKEYQFHGAIYMYEDSAYCKGSSEEINSYLREKMEDKPFSYYFSRKFADFTGLFMGFFATIMLSVLFLQDTRKHVYELLHTKPVTAGRYVIGKVGAGFGVCLVALGILNLLFWILCLMYTRGSGMEVRIWDFLVATALYVLPNMLMIVSVYTLISLVFKNPFPGVPLLLLYMVYSNMGRTNAEGVYGYYGRLLAIMVRFPGQFFDTSPPPKVLLNQSFLILASICIILISIQLWKRRRV